MVVLTVDEIAEGISRVLKPEALRQPSIKAEDETELVERRDSRLVATPLPLEGDIVYEISLEEIQEYRNSGAVGIDEGLWRWIQGTHDTIVCNAGWITTSTNCPYFAKEVSRDWAIIARNVEVLRSNLPGSLRNRVFQLSSKKPIEDQIDKLCTRFMQKQLRSAIQSAAELSQIKIDEIDGALRAHSHKDIDDLGNFYKYIHEKTSKLAVFVVKRPRIQSVVRHYGLNLYSDDRAFYLEKMAKKRKNPENFVRSHWIRERDPRISAENQVTMCWIMTPRNLVFRVETFYWMAEQYGHEILMRVMADSYQNGGGYFPLHQTMAHQHFSMSYGFRQMLQAKLTFHLEFISPESAPLIAYGRS